MTDAPGSRRGAWTLVATGLGLFMIFLDAMIVNVAIPDIQQEFHAGESGIQWVVAAYSLTMAMFMMSGGTFGDHYGRRRGYVAGIVLFCAASVACGVAPGIGVLIAARGLQGVGAAIVNVASLALVGAAFPDPRARRRARSGCGPRSRRSGSRSARRWEGCSPRTSGGGASSSSIPSSARSRSG
jgi:MFS family permease